MYLNIFMKTFISLLRILMMKTTFSYLSGMFENPAPAEKLSDKRNINLKTKTKILWNINFIWSNASIRVVLNNFLLYATDGSKISSNPKPIVFDVSKRIPSFANTPFKLGGSLTKLCKINVCTKWLLFPIF